MSTPQLPSRLAAFDDVNPAAVVAECEGTATTWAQLREIGAAVERELGTLGLGTAARVGVVLANRPESIALARHTWATSRCLTVFNPLQPAERLAADIERTAPPVLFAPASVWEEPQVAEAASRAGIIAYALDGTVVRRVGLSADGPPATVAFAPDVAVELTTSGTTGPPKRIPLTYRQIDAALGSVDGHMTPGRREREPFTGGTALVTAPIVHIGGLWSVLQALTEARRMIVLKRFTVDGWRAVIREHRPAIAGLPPAAMRSVLDADVPAEDLASLRAITSGTAPVPADLADEFLARYGIPVLVVYGATEFSGAVAGWSLRDHSQWWAAKRGSVGRAFPGVALRVVGEDGTDLGADTPGVLEIRTPQAGGGADGWTRTSDLARIDADGFLWIEGRADDVIIRGGFKVQPATVVAALQRHPAIREAAVAGLPDPRLGHVPVAAFEVRPGHVAPGDDELRTWCRSELLPYEVPTRFLAVDELPRSVSTKVSRPDLVALFEQDPARSSAAS